jgi:hypothetical protein
VTSHPPPLPPLDEDLLLLCRRESEGYPEDSAMRERVFAKVELAVALGPGPDGGGGGHDQGGGGHHDGGNGGGGGGVPPRGAAGLSLRRLIGVGLSTFVAGGVTGAVAVHGVSPGGAPRDPSALVATSAPATAAADLSDANPAVQSSFAAPTSANTAPETSLGLASPARSSLVPSTPLVASAAGDLVRERELLDVARAALARNRPEDAIATAQRHAEQWPRGRLAEEREALLVQALAAAGRRQEAARRADSFRRAYPTSILLPVVDGVLGADAGP